MKDCVKAREAEQRYRERHPRRVRENGRRAVRRYRERHGHARRDFVNRWKVTAGCIDCGFSNHTEALDFDHMFGSKHANIGKMISDIVRWPALLVEILKCVVRCANCHRIVTAERRS